VTDRTTDDEQVLRLRLKTGQNTRVKSSVKFDGSELRTAERRGRTREWRHEAGAKDISPYEYFPSGENRQISDTRETHDDRGSRRVAVHVVVRY